MPLPTSGNGLELLIIQICCGIVVYVSVCLRLWAQHINRKRPSLHNNITTRRVSLHDVLMHVSVFFYTIQAVIVIRGIIEGGIGQHANDIDQTEIAIGFQTCRQRLGVGFGTHSRLNENADSMAKESRHSSPVEFRRGTLELTEDFLYETVDVAKWTVIEAAIGIVAGCLPTTGPLLRLMIPRRTSPVGSPFPMQSSYRAHAERGPRLSKNLPSGEIYVKRSFSLSSNIASDTSAALEVSQESRG
ncbi:hypothetical protein H9L39_08042 [Fusarium oxysporum f. sp. albedinis]|nr:hypothetical protein H9L39_08042 [Fusarium oxysporum f. sp. albedinis]